MVRSIPLDRRRRETGDEVGEELITMDDAYGLHHEGAGSLLLETLRFLGIIYRGRVDKWGGDEGRRRGDGRGCGNI